MKNYGKISITNVKNIGTLSVSPKVNMPASVIYDPETKVYNPDWSSTNLIFEPVVAFNGEVISSGYSIEFKRRDGGGSDQNLTTGESSDGKKLTVSKNVLGTSVSGVITYIANVSYYHASTKTTLKNTISVTFSLTQNASSVKYISIVGENVFIYNSNQELQGSSYITLEATLTNTTIKQWQYRKSDGTFAAFPTTNNSSITGKTLKVYASESSIFFDDKAVIKVLANEDDLYDIITIAKVRDGAPGGQSIVATLSNSSHVIPCDKDGIPYTYEGAETTVHVYEGGIDVTDEWTITATAEPSGSIGGSYSASTHTYKLSNMTSETGYIVFTCKRSGDSDLTVRFSLTKNRAGNDGENAIIYLVESNTLVINKNKSGTMSHSSVIFSSFYKVGTSKSKKPFSGRFKIYETTVENATDSDFVLKYSSTADEYSKEYTPSSTNIKCIKCELYDAGSFNTALDQTSVVVTSDGDKGDTGNPGTDAINVMLGNEAEIIPCTTANVTAQSQNILIPFYALRGTTRVACTAAINETLPSGMTKSITNATTSADGLITLSVSSGANLGGTSVTNGQINIVFTCAGKSFTKKFCWTKSKAASNGTDAILFQIQAPYGDIIINKSNNVTLTALLYSGATVVTATSYTWKKFTDGNYVSISGQTNSSIEITPDMVDSMASFCCEAVYNSKTYIAYYCVYDKTDPYEIFVDSSIGTQLINNTEPGAIYTRVMQNGKELDPLKSAIFSVTPPVSPSNGDYYYKIDSANKKCTLMKYNKSAWVEVTSSSELPIYTYRYYKSDVAGNLVSLSDLSSSSAWREGKVIYFDNEDTNPTLNLIVEITDSTS